MKIQIPKQMDDSYLILFVNGAFDPAGGQIKTQQILL